MIIGNGTVGSNNPMSKLDDSKVKQIKLLLKQGFSGRSIGKHFGVHQTVISKINFGLSWSHITI